MSDQIDISAKAVASAWHSFNEASTAIGSNGDVDLYDIDGMFQAAQDMNALIVALRAALDRAEADKAAAVEAERERCAALIDCGGCYDYPCCNPTDCNAILAAAIRTGAKP
jgi:hypothetical protein